MSPDHWILDRWSKLITWLSNSLIINPSGPHLCVFQCFPMIQHWNSLEKQELMCGGLICSQQLGVECLQNKKKQSWSGNSTGGSLQSLGSNNQEGTAKTFFKNSFWHGNISGQDWKSLHKILCSALKIMGQVLRSLAEIHYFRLKKRNHNIPQGC